MAYGNYAPFYRGGYFNTAQTPTFAPYQQMSENNSQYMPQYQQNLQPTQMSPTNDFLWVLNENEATAFPVAVGGSVVLWDKNSPTIYVKSVNAQGVPSMRVLDFTERSQTVQAEKKPGVEFATLDAFNALQSELEAVKRKLEQMQTKKQKKNELLEVDDDGESFVQPVRHSER